MQSGDKVELRAFGGVQITRRLVAVSGDTLLVCSEEEYQQAKNGGRDPVAVGFPMDAWSRRGPSREFRNDLVRAVPGSVTPMPPVG